MNKWIFGALVTIVGVSLIAGILINDELDTTFDDLLKDLHNDIKL